MDRGWGVSRRQFMLGSLGVAASMGLAGAGHAVADQGGTGAPLTGRFPAAAALTWTAATYELVLAENLSPPAAARTYAYAAIGMYEAVVAGMPAHRSLGGQLTGLPSMPPPVHRGQLDWPTAMSTTVATVLAAVLPFGSSETRPLLESTHQQLLAVRRAAAVPDRMVSASQEHGRRVAAVLSRWIAADGHAGIVGRPYTPPDDRPSDWESTPPNFRPAIEPYWSEVRPLALRSSEEIAPAPHLPFDPDPSSAFGRQALTTYQQSFQNTEEQKAIARFWTDNPGSFTPPLGSPTGLPSGHWMLIGSEGIRVGGLALDRAVETYALLGVALHDAFLNCWTWKYRFNLLRPITYVRRYIDPHWSTFINTPQFPEYTSGHSVASPAAASVLTHLLGSFAFTDDSHAPRGMPARRFSSFRHAAEEAAQSRLYGGIHYPMAIEEGLAQGDAVGAAVLARVRTRR